MVFFEIIRFVFLLGSVVVQARHGARLPYKEFEDYWADVVARRSTSAALPDREMQIQVVELP